MWPNNYPSNYQHSLKTVWMVVESLSQLIACKCGVSPTCEQQNSNHHQNSTGHYFPATSTVRRCMSVLVETVWWTEMDGGGGKSICQSEKLLMRNNKTNGIIKLLILISEEPREIPPPITQRAHLGVRDCARQGETERESLSVSSKVWNFNGILLSL